MKTRYDDLEVKDYPAQENLEIVAFHLTQLYQRLSQDFDRWAVTGNDLMQTVKTLDHQVEKFKKLDEEVRKQLDHSLEKAIQDITISFTRSLEQTTQTVLAREITSVADNLYRTVQKVEQSLQGYKKQIQYLRTWDMIVNLLSAVVGGLIAGAVIYYFVFKSL